MLNHDFCISKALLSKKTPTLRLKLKEVFELAILGIKLSLAAKTCAAGDFGADMMRAKPPSPSSAVLFQTTPIKADLAKFHISALLFDRTASDLSLDLAGCSGKSFPALISIYAAIQLKKCNSYKYANGISVIEPPSRWRQTTDNTSTHLNLDLDPIHRTQDPLRLARDSP